MLFRVSNLGPIRKAELDLSKDLIVLTGPNNTGKTYLTWAVYGLVPSGIEPRPGAASGVARWIEALFEAQDAGRPVSEVTLSKAAFEETIAEDLIQRLPEEFASPPEHFRDTHVELQFTRRDLKKFDRSRWTINLGKGRFCIQFGESDEARALPIEGQEDQQNNVDPSELLAVHRDNSELNSIFPFVLAATVLDFGAVAFPVERMAISLFAREIAANRTQLVDELLERPLRRQETLRRRAGRYPRAIRDALQRALKLRSMEMSEFAELADELEREVLGGKLSKTEFDELEFNPTGLTESKPLGLHQSASVIKSLASLVWHLRYEARHGQRLIIDEPELNLHPDNQRRIARILAKAVNRGLKIMMSTHSDYVVRELNNLIMLSQDSDAARGLAKDLGVDPISTIKPDRLGVYLVHGGECRPVPVTETGFEVATIDKEIHLLNHDAQTIYSRLFDE